MKISVTEIEFQQSFVRCYTRYYAQQNSIIFSIFVVVINNQICAVRTTLELIKKTSTSTCTKYYFFFRKCNYKTSWGKQMGAYFQNIELLETRSDNESALIIGGK